MTTKKPVGSIQVTTLTIALAFAGVALAMWILAAYQGPMKKWLAMIIALVSMLPLFIWETVFPAAFDLTCYAKSVDYEFRDPVYAIEFEALNCDANSGELIPHENPEH